MGTNAFRIAFRQDSWLWTASLLNECHHAELEVLSLLMGIAKSGLKDVKVRRLLNAAQVRQVTTQTDDPGVLAEKYKGKELKDLCKLAGIYGGGTKHAQAVALLNWRNECRRKGQQALKEWKALRAAKPFRQMRLFPA